MSRKEAFDLTLAQECARAFSAACDVGCVVSDTEGAVIYESGYGCASCGICNAAGRHRETCMQSQVYGMTESERFGGKYIYFCPMGLTCFVSPILGSEHSEAQLTVGPFLMVDTQDYILCDLEEQLHLCGDPLDGVVRALKNIPYIPTEKVNQMSTLLFMAVGFMNNVSAANRMLETQGADAIHSQITAYIQHLKSAAPSEPYPLETEQALLRAVRQANKAQAQKHLNELLGYILFAVGGDFPRCKTRIYELLVLISRTAIDAGANPEETLNASHRYLTEITQLRDFDALCLWLVRVTNTLMDSIFDFTDTRHANVIHQSVQYIRAHYSEKITLEDMAQRAYLSPAYFSRVFKDEMNEPFSAYLNQVRIGRSKELLLQRDLRLADIAMMVGFEDQSYFTKVFKKAVGMTPLRYREEMRKQ